MLKGIKRGKGSKGALYDLHSLLSTIPFYYFYSIYHLLFTIHSLLYPSLFVMQGNQLLFDDIWHRNAAFLDGTFP